MNLIFTTIWNEARQCMIVVSEFASVVGKSAKSSGKKINRALFGSNKLVTALSAGIANFSTSLLFAGSLPEGSSVTYGQGQVTQSGNEMTITQTSAKMAIDWNSFNIGQGHKVTFVQPSTSSVAMNRVTGTDVSVIQGSLQANGQVFLSNPNGVLFTKDAQVNVGSLVATTLQMSNENLASGRYRLQGKSDKSVTNQGSITATSSDGKGGVAIIAAKIINEGSITVDRGTVALAAAHKVTLDLGGPVKVQIEEGALNALIEQGGAVRADGGTVIMSARAASNLMSSAINHTGVIEARSMVADANGVIQLSAGTNGSIVIDGTLDVSSPSAKAGRIDITGKDITLKKNSHLIASGDLGGGIVLIGGDWQGSGSLQQAQHVVMEQGASINASALTKGDGGKVVLWSDVHDHASLTSVSGEIIATAGLLGGNGGKVETSGRILDVMGFVDAGKGGEWLLDPVDITISNAGGGGSVPAGGGTYNTAGVVSNTSISTALSNGNNVTISTNNSGATNGNITVSSNITSTSSTTNTLTLNANASIEIASGISIKGTGSGALNLSLNSNLSGNGGYVWMRGSNSISTNGGSVSLGSEARRAVGMLTGTSKGIQLDSAVNITTSGGDIAMYGQGASFGNATSGGGILISSASIINSGSGKILIDGISGSQTASGGGGQGVTFFTATGAASIGTFTSGNSNNIFITSTNSATASDWQTNISFVSPILIKSSTADNFNTAAGLTIQQSGGGANGSLDIYVPNGHLKWIADGGNFAINARAPVRVNANGAVFAWGSKTNSFNPNVSTTPFEINVNTDLRNSISLNGNMSFIPTRSNVTLQNGGFSWIPSATQFETWFSARNLSLGDSRTTSVVLSETINLPNSSLTLNTPAVFSGSVSWTVNEISSSNTISTSSNVSINANKIDFSGVVSGSGSFNFRPLNSNSSIRIGDTATGSMYITRATIENLNMSGANSVLTIGSLNGTGAISFSDPNLLTWRGNTSFLSDSGNIVLNGSSQFNGNLNITTSGNINLGGNITSLGNQTYSSGISLLRDLNISSSNGSVNLSSGINLGTAILNISQSTNSTWSGVVSGEGTLIKAGVGNLTLAGSNTYTGLTRIISGQIIATHANSLGNVSAATEIDGGGLVVTGSLVVAEPLSIKGSGMSGNGAVISASGSNILSGALTLQAASTINTDSGSSLNVTGAINGGSLLTAIGSGNYTFGLIGNSTPVAGLNITNANNVIFSNSVNSSSDISVKTSGNININGPLVATNSMVKLNTTGVVTQNSSGSITASSLALLGVGGNYTLNSSTNNVSTFAADTGTIIYKNAGTLTIGTVNPTGITATGPVSISTLTGNLMVSQNISTTDTSSSALILNAGLNSAAGTVSGGDIVFSGSPLITVGTGGRATLYSGSIVGTTALASSIGNGSLRFRYGSDETSTNFTTALGMGKYLIYRENRTINLTANDAIKVFDGIPWATDAGYTCTSCVNGDAAVTISYGGTAQGAVNLGTYSITPIATNLSALGYAIGTLTDGALTIATSLPSSVVSTPAETETNVASLGIIQKMTALKFNTFDSPKEQVWGMSPDSRLSYVNVSESDAIISRSFEKVEIRSQSKTDKSNTSVSDKKENIPTDDSWSKLSGIIPIRVVKGGIKQPELEEDFQEVRRYGNGR